MARLQHRFGTYVWIVYAILLMVPVGTATRHPQAIQERGFFDDIGNAFTTIADDVATAIVNTFDTIEMCVLMPIFDPVANFFTMTVPSAAEIATETADSFFMKANTFVVGGLYDLTMLTNDIANFVNTGVVDAENSIGNFATYVGQGIISTEMAAGSLVTNLATEFDNVVAPAITGALDEAGDEIANIAAGDILPALQFAGNYLAAHPELIAKIACAIAITAITAVAPELAGGDAALIADIVAEAGAEGAADAAATVAADATEEEATESIFSNTLGKITDMLEAQVQPSNPLKLAKGDAFNFYDNIQNFLDLSDQNETIATIEFILPMSQETLTNIQNIVVPLQQSTLGVVSTYTNINTVINNLRASGKVMKRDAGEALLEERAKKVKTSTSHTSSKSTTAASSSTSGQSSTTSTSISMGVGGIINSMGGFTSSTIPASSTISSETSASATGTSTVPIGASTTTPILTVPLLNLTTFVQYHWFNRTTGGRTYAKMMLRDALMTHLTSFSTSTSLVSSGQLPVALTSALPTVVYPATASSRALAISSQIATGNATAYNQQNQTVMIIMDKTATPDPCLNLTVINCHFGNQQTKPFCTNQCYNRWYNLMGTTVAQY